MPVLPVLVGIPVDPQLIVKFVSLAGITAIAWIALDVLRPKMREYGIVFIGVLLLAVSIAIDLFASVGELTLAISYASDLTKLLAVVSILAGISKLRKDYIAEEARGER
ncbi:MAG: hypothetical protein NTY90_00620 [Candidatus Micrarchaeota archaeon]|nr:hypothetical protein [Candidatus Micrarchaeota archaeon]